MLRTILKETFKVDEQMKKNKSIYMDCDALFDGEEHTIAMKAILGDFGPSELADAVETAEILYEKLEKPVILCLGMSAQGKVTVPEMDIKSDADFIIKLAIVDFYKVAIERTKERIANGTAGDIDREALQAMPMTVPRHMRKKVREECFALLQQF